MILALSYLVQISFNLVKGQGFSKKKKKYTHTYEYTNKIIGTYKFKEAKILRDICKMGDYNMQNLLK